MLGQHVFASCSDMYCVTIYQLFISLFLGALAKLWQVTLSFIMFVSPSICMEQLGCHWTDFREILYLSIFLNTLEKIQVFIKTGQE